MGEVVTVLFKGTGWVKCLLYCSKWLGEVLTVQWHWLGEEVTVLFKGTGWVKCLLFKGTGWVKWLLYCSKALVG